MKLKTVYKTEEEIPEGYADLYTERNGQWELVGIEGVKTMADVERVQESLRKERNDHKVTRDKLAVFGDLDPAQVHEQLENAESVKEQLEALKASGGTLDETKLEPIISARLKQVTGPMERDKLLLQRKLDDQAKLTADALGEVGTLKGVITSGNVERSIRDAAAEAKLVPTAVNDAVLNGTRVFELADDGRVLTRDVPGTTPGLTPKEWLKDMQEKAPHWWPASVGTGSRGGTGPGGTGGPNPWSKQSWNLTQQGAYVRQHGEAKGAEMAARAGCKLGDTKPAAA